MDKSGLQKQTKPPFYSVKIFNDVFVLVSFSKISYACLDIRKSSVADLDPSDPYVFGLLDPDPDPLVRGMDTDPSIVKQK